MRTPRTCLPSSPVWTFVRQTKITEIDFSSLRRAPSSSSFPLNNFAFMRGRKIGRKGSRLIPMNEKCFSDFVFCLTSLSLWNGFSRSARRPKTLGITWDVVVLVVYIAVNDYEYKWLLGTCWTHCREVFTYYKFWVFC